MKILKAIALFSCLISVTASALALAAPSSLQPALGEKACFERKYTSDHLRRNPKQHLSSMYILVTHMRDSYSDGGTYDWVNGTVVGASKNEYYMNDNAGCVYKADGSISCNIECDGGAFEVYPQSDSVLFQVAKDYYFPLYRRGTDQETAGREDVLHFSSDDRDNAVYKLYPVEVKKCEAAIARAKIRSWGC